MKSGATISKWSRTVAVVSQSCGIMEAIGRGDAGGREPANGPLKFLAHVLSGE